MMSRFLYTIALFAMTILPVCAQTYTVYSVIGSSKIMQGQKAVPLTPQKQLRAQDKVILEPESAITLLDEKNSKMYSFSVAGTHQVKQLIARASSHAKQVSKRYMSFLVKQLFSDESKKMTHPDTYMQVAATSYRSSSNDSLFLSRLSNSLPMIDGHTAEELLCMPEHAVEGDMDVSFELVSCDTGFPIKGKVAASTGSYVRVTNNTEESLYVNVLDIDKRGNKYLVLPVDAAASCAHLLVPAMSTVSFKSEPFIFSDDPSQETFLLVATEEPVDFSILMNPIARTSKNAMKVGFSRNFYQVK